MARRGYGQWGKPLRIFDMYEDWRDTCIELQEAGVTLDTPDLEPDSKLALELLEASPDSRADFASFLYGTVRIAFYTGYQRASFQWRRYAAKDSAQDFREKRIKGFAGMSGIGYVGELGTRPGMRWAFRPEASVMVDTYGADYSITRQAIRNDDTNQILSRTPDEMGYAAGVFIQQAVVSLIVSNPTAPDGTAMFSSSRATNAGVVGNSATAFLSEDSLLDGIVYLQTQRDDLNRPIVVKADTLVVQNDRMAAIARRILNSQITGLRTADASGIATGQMAPGVNNPLSDAGLLPGGVVVDNFLPDPHDWYLFADPNTIPGFTIAFLDGEETPFLGMREPQIRGIVGPDTDPYSWDFRTLDYMTEFDFGSAPVDPRGVYRSLVA